MPNRQRKQTKRKSRRPATVKGESRALALLPFAAKITRGVQLLNYPQMKRVVLRYSDLFPVSAAAAATTRYFQVNSLHDFDATGTGHQPRMYDQLCTSTGPYTVYRVLGIRVRLTGAPKSMAGTSAQTSALLVAGFSTGAAPTAPTGSMVSNIWPNTEIAGWAGALIPQNTSRVLEFNRTVASIFGVPEVHVKGEDNYQGVAGSNPTNMCYFYVQYQSADATNATDMNLTLDAEFDVQLENPLQQTPS